MDANSSKETSYHGSIEEEAYVQFIHQFYNESDDPVSVNFTTGNLVDIVHQKCVAQNGLVLLYLHNISDEFSINFCNFLRDPSVENLFREGLFYLLPWNIGANDCRHVLADIISSLLGEEFSDFVYSEKSAVLLIGDEVGNPRVFNVFQEPVELVNLHTQLNEYKNLRARLIDSEDTAFKMTPRNYQQTMLDQLGDRDYDCFESNEHEFLKKKIGFALYGPPNEDEGSYSKDQERDIEKLYEQIVKQNDQFSKWRGKVVISFVFVCVEPLPQEKEEKMKYFTNRFETYDPDIDFEVVPIFVLRKCKHSDPNNNGRNNLCRTIIDKEGRIYQSWAKFIENNKLPQATITYPTDGRYQTLPYDSDVLIEVARTPSCKLLNKVAGKMDSVLGIGGMVAGGIALLVAAPIVALPAAAVGITSGVYATARSIQTITDRSKHGQKLTPANAESRAAYLNIAGGLLNVAMLGSVKTVSYLASQGVAFGQGAKFMLFGLNGATVVVGGIGIGNSVYDMIRRGKRPSSLQLAQLGASVFFFGNSIYNFKAVGAVIDESQARALADIENNLRSNRHRRTFNKLLRDTVEEHSSATRGKAEVISSIRKMDDVNEVMAALTRSNKMCNDQGITYTVRNGQIQLNGVPVNMMEIGAMSNVDRSAFLQSLPPIPENLTPTVKMSITREVKNIFADHALGILYKCASTGSMDKFVTEILSAFKPLVRDFILSVARRFITGLQIPLINKLERIFPLDNVLVILMRWVTMTLKDFEVFKRVLNMETLTLREIEEILSMLKSKFNCWFTEFVYDAGKNTDRKVIRRNENVKIRKCCAHCQGYYYV